MVDALALVRVGDTIRAVIEVREIRPTSRLHAHVEQPRPTPWMRL